MTSDNAHLRPHVRRGFTLLELVLAMSIAAMLMLALYSLLAVANKAKRTAENAVSPARTTSIAADLIGRDLQSVVPPNGILSGPFIGTKPGGQNGGDADSVSFYCVGSDGDFTPQSEGVRNVELVLRTDVTPSMLVRRVNRNLLAQTQLEPEEEILCRNVKSFTVRYYDGTTWSDTYDSTTLDNVLPLAVELTLELNIGSNGGANASSASDANAASTYKVRRVISLACATPAATTE